jgi:hypothetical protein
MIDMLGCYCRCGPACHQPKCLNGKTPPDTGWGRLLRVDLGPGALHLLLPRFDVVVLFGDFFHEFHCEQVLADVLATSSGQACGRP